jgi:hypothetical protein
MLINAMTPATTALTANPTTATRALGSRSGSSLEVADLSKQRTGYGQLDPDHGLEELNRHATFSINSH